MYDLFKCYHLTDYLEDIPDEEGICDRLTIFWAPNGIFVTKMPNGTPSSVLNTRIPILFSKFDKMKRIGVVVRSCIYSLI